MGTPGWHPGLRESALFDRNVIHEIQRAAREGIYDIRGFGAKRQVPHFDDLLFLGASMSRYPLEGYRERCATDVVLGDRFASKPLHLDIPITIAGMSFGALSAPAKEALGRGGRVGSRGLRKRQSHDDLRKSGPGSSRQTQTDGPRQATAQRWASFRIEQGPCRTP